MNKLVWKKHLEVGLQSFQNTYVQWQRLSSMHLRSKINAKQFCLRSFIWCSVDRSITISRGVAPDMVTWPKLAFDSSLGYLACADSSVLLSKPLTTFAEWIKTAALETERPWSAYPHVRGLFDASPLLLTPPTTPSSSRNGARTTVVRFPSHLVRVLTSSSHCVRFHPRIMSRFLLLFSIAFCTNSIGFIVGCRSFVWGFLIFHTSLWLRSPHQ